MFQRISIDERLPQVGQIVKVFRGKSEFLCKYVISPDGHGVFEEKHFDGENTHVQAVHGVTHWEIPDVQVR